MEDEEDYQRDMGDFGFGALAASHEMDDAEKVLILIGRDK
jgi:hypothetical protein